MNTDKGWYPHMTTTKKVRLQQTTVRNNNRGHFYGEINNTHTVDDKTATKV